MNTKLKDLETIIENLPKELEYFGFFADTKLNGLVTFCNTGLNLDNFEEIGEATKEDVLFVSNTYALFCAVIHQETNPEVLKELRKLIDISLDE